MGTGIKKMALSCRLIKSAMAGIGLVVAGVAGVSAQEETSAQKETSAATRVSGWAAQCASQSRSSVLHCNVEQGLFLAEGGQQFAKVSIRVPGDTHKPDVIIQLPHGIHLPSGIKIQFDDGTAETQQVQTCDGKGCYVVLKDATRTVVSMKGGKTLRLSFKNLSLDDIEAVMPLDGFTAAYESAE